MTDLEPGDVVTLNTGDIEYTVRAVGLLGADVYIVPNAATGTGTWVGVRQVRLKRKKES